jgi:hypothetical protein
MASVSRCGVKGPRGHIGGLTNGQAARSGRWSGHRSSKGRSAPQDRAVREPLGHIQLVERREEGAGFRPPPPRPRSLREEVLDRLRRLRPSPAGLDGLDEVDHLGIPLRAPLGRRLGESGPLGHTVGEGIAHPRLAGRLGDGQPIAEEDPALLGLGHGLGSPSPGLRRGHYSVVPFHTLGVWAPRPPLGFVPDWRGQDSPAAGPERQTNGLSDEYKRPDILRTSVGLQESKRPVVPAPGPLSHACVQNYLCPFF